MQRSVSTPLLQRSSDSPRRRALKRFLSHRPALLGLLVLLIFVLTASLANIIAADPNTIDLLKARSGPSPGHLLGVDQVGRDILARLVHGARVSLLVGLLAVGLYLVIGCLLGALAGYYGGWVDMLIMRVADALLSFPTILIILALVALVGQGLDNIILVIGLLGWPEVARIVRASFLSLRKQDYVQAAVALGASDQRVIFRHIFPSVLGSLVVAGTFGIAQAILMEAGLSFLGLGVQPPTPSWGNMLADAQSLTILEQMPWLWLPPGLAITLVVLSINFVGDGLRDALTPNTK